ncbi:acetyltransferase domain-containing protein [Xylaria digitata]|nr:acetyltransferase domain-containing protein [Xylaria digitata]
MAMASPSLPAPPHAPPVTPSKIKVKTTSPSVPPNIDRAPIRTERLLIRPFDASDAEAVYELRKQPEVMQWTALGEIDKDVNQSLVYIERFLPPKDLDTYNFVVVYLGDTGKSEDANGVVIGVAGCHKIRNDFGWPEVGYMFRKEYWGRGLGTEFLRAFTKAWWALPRNEIQLEVEAASVEKWCGKNDGDVIQVPEILTAIIEAGNGGSRKVLERAGFREYNQWTEPDSRAGFEESTATLVAFLLESPGH